MPTPSELVPVLALAGPPTAPTVRDIQSTIEPWGPAAKAAAKAMIAKYGPPREATSLRLIWADETPWRVIEVVNDEVSHAFPVPHADVLYQAIAYPVAADKLDDLASFDGSLTVERTRGLLGVRGAREDLNIATLNLAREILVGRRNATQARRAYAEIVQLGAHPDLMTRLAFVVPEAFRGTPDHPMLLERPAPRRASGARPSVAPPAEPPIATPPPAG